MTPLRLALWLLAVCGVAAWQLTVIPQSLMQMTVGPVLAPAAIVAGLTLVTVLYGLSAWRGRQVDLSQEAGQEALPGSTTRLLSLLGGGWPSSCWSSPWVLCCRAPCAACALPGLLMPLSMASHCLCAA